MKNYIAGLCVAILAVAVLQPTAYAQTDAAQRATMMETIQALLLQIEQLQARIAEMRGEVREIRQEIRETLREGARGDEVRKLQELLASDSEIYPEAMVTGYFGGLTRGAVMRLQQRHQLPATGELDEATRELINAYFEQRGNAQTPAGILRAPGIRQAVERGVCDRGRGNRPFCPTTSAAPVATEVAAEEEAEEAEEAEEVEEEEEVE